MLTQMCGAKISAMHELAGITMVTGILTSVGKLITSHLFPKEVQTTCPIFVRFNGKTMLPDRMIVCHAWLRPVVTRI